MYMNWIYFLILVGTPILLLIFLNCDNKKNNLNGDLCCLFNYFLKISGYIFFIIFMKESLNLNYDVQMRVKNLLLSFLYFSTFMGLIIFINYFSTKGIELKKNIKIYLEEIINFGQDIFNIIFLIILIYTRSNENLFIGLISAYIFYALTEINKNYKIRKVKITKKHSINRKKIVIMQAIVNVSTLYYFTLIESIILCLYTESIVIVDYKKIVLFIIFLVIISINVYLPKIIKKFGKIKK